MPIQIKCACGKSLQAKDELAGKKVRCPGCNEILIAPPAEDAVAQALPAAPPRKLPPPLVFDESDEQTAVTEKPTVKAKAHSYDDADDDEDEVEERLARRKRRRQASADRLHTSQGGAGTAVLTGVGLMVAGVVLFVGPLAFGCFWPYPIVLFIAGALSVIRGALQK